MVAILFKYYKHVITKYYFKFLTRKLSWQMVNLPPVNSVMKGKGEHLER